MPLLTDEATARAWIATLPGVSRETWSQLDGFAELLLAENERQNLVAKSTVEPDVLWTRHIADSAQLLHHARGFDGRACRWVDLGSGAGLPGLVVAIIAPHITMTLVETRKRRCDFLRDCVERLQLGDRVAVVESRSEKFVESKPFDIISARAFAPLPDLIAVSRHLAGSGTMWLLPKGQNAAKELSSAPASWQKMFHVEPSLTDDAAGIIIGRGLPPTR